MTGEQWLRCSPTLGATLLTLKDRLQFIDGHRAHCVESYLGDRSSVVWYTHKCVWQCENNLICEAVEAGFRPPDEPNQVKVSMWCTQPMGYKVQQRMVAAECEQIEGESFSAARSKPIDPADSPVRDTEIERPQPSSDTGPLLKPGGSDRTAGGDEPSSIDCVKE